MNDLDRYIRRKFIIPKSFEIKTRKQDCNDIYGLNPQDKKLKYGNHRKIVETHIGRKLSSNEEIHHIDKNPRNNDVSNLLIVSHDEHEKIHNKRIPKWNQ